MSDKHKQVIRQRRERERQQRIQSILRAAKKVFLSRGYVRATMDEIAFEAEISKPTIYQYFKAKDDLYFSLMLPVVEEIGRQLDRIEKDLEEDRYQNGSELMRSLFLAFVRSHDISPEVFRIVQMFQQSGLVSHLDETTRSALNEKGRRNFDRARKIVEFAIERGLFRKVNVHEFVDVLWGAFVGIVQLEDIKSQGHAERGHLESTLDLAEQILVDFIAPEKH